MATEPPPHSTMSLDTKSIGARQTENLRPLRLLVTLKQSQGIKAALFLQCCGKAMWGF